MASSGLAIEPLTIEQKFSRRDLERSRQVIQLPMSWQSFIGLDPNCIIEALDNGIVGARIMVRDTRSKNRLQIIWGDWPEQRSIMKYGRDGRTLKHYIATTFEPLADPVHVIIRVMGYAAGK